MDADRRTPTQDEAPSAVDSLGTVMDADGHFHVTDAPIDLSRYGIEDWIAMAFFWLLAGVVFHQFFTRYALNDSASWTEEIARYLLICTVFVGAAIGVRRNNHVQVDFLYRVLPRLLMRVLSTLVDLFRVAFLGYAAWLTWLLIGRIGGQRMSIVDWPIGVVYAVVLFGFVLMTWRAVQVAIANWKRGASVLERPDLAELH
jgi:TRAP-type C4-dicarboxylate transport system permease small subunit